MAKLQVIFTVDTEVWPGSWDDLDARFPEAFQRYVYGDTPQGQYALPMTLRILNDHGLRGVFFVEPLFSARFGLAPLQEIVGLIQDGGQDVQMHLHAEWADEAREPVLPAPATSKRQHISYFSLEEQFALIRWARARLVAAGAPVPTVFRAGSLRFNLDTLRALLANGITRDSSYSHCRNGPQSGVLESYPRGTVPVGAREVGGVVEFPLSVFYDRPGNLRPLQLTACSLRELTRVLDLSAERQHPFVNILTHNFELLDRRNFSVDQMVVRRFVGLCNYLQTNTDRFETVTFDALSYAGPDAPLEPVRGPLLGLARRLAEQLLRRAPAMTRRVPSTPAVGPVSPHVSLIGE